jgi:hypothetical protein
MLIVTPTRRGTCRRCGQADPSYFRWCMRCVAHRILRSGCGYVGRLGDVADHRWRIRPGLGKRTVGHRSDGVVSREQTVSQATRLATAEVDTNRRFRNGFWCRGHLGRRSRRRRAAGLCAGGGGPSRKQVVFDLVVQPTHEHRDEGSAADVAAHQDLAAQKVQPRLPLPEAVNYMAEDYPCVLDLLRNEDPIYVNFVAGGWDQASIETTDEPIGEGELA